MPTPRGKKFVFTALGVLFVRPICVLAIFAVAAPAALHGQSSAPLVRRVRVLDSRNAVEIEVEGSERLLPQTQVLTGPDRLVVDFPKALPGKELRNTVVNRGEVKSVRVGLFQSAPPVTRVVLDLKTPQSFQVFPYGRTVIIKVTGGAPVQAGGVPPGNSQGNNFAASSGPGLVAANYHEAGQTAPGRGGLLPAVDLSPATVPLDVAFRNGLLSIHANKASLSEILFAVHERTGAEIAVAAGAEADQVVAEYGPAPAPEVLAQLLNGSRFNFLIVSNPDNPQKLDRVILSVRGNGVVVPLPPMPTTPEPAQEDPEPVAANAPNDAATASPPQGPPGSQPETRPDENGPH